MRYRYLNEVLLDWNNDLNISNKDDALVKVSSEDLTYNPCVVDFKGLYKPSNLISNSDLNPLELPFDKGKYTRCCQIFTPPLSFVGNRYFTETGEHMAGQLIHAIKIEVWINNILIHFSENTPDFKLFLDYGNIRWNYIKKFVKNISVDTPIEVHCKFTYKEPVTNYFRFFSVGDSLIKLLEFHNTKEVINMKYLFAQDFKLTDICLFDTRNVQNAEGMFLCTHIKTIPKGFNFKKVTNAENMFRDCVHLEGPLPTLDMPLVDKKNSGVFKNCSFDWWKKYNQGFN